MNNNFKILIKLYSLFMLITGICSAANLANPLTPIPEARIGIGASYHLGGHTLTNREVPSVFNRYYLRLNYSPLQYFNIGFDLGAAHIDVAADTAFHDTTGIFHGKAGLSYGGQMKLSTPLFIFEKAGLISITEGTYFSCENSNSALYQGYDLSSAVGIILHIPDFGYLACGSKLYYIADGENKAYNSKKTNGFSNVNNIRGWIAFDYFPQIATMKNLLPYISLEVSIGPEADIGYRAPLEGISFSVSIGTITERLYGEKSRVDWKP